MQDNGAKIIETAENNVLLTDRGSIKSLDLIKMNLENFYSPVTLALFPQGTYSTYKINVGENTDRYYCY